MMNAISRCKGLACEVTSCTSLGDQKPDSARIKKGVDDKLAAIGKALSKLYSPSVAECCTPGSNADPKRFNHTANGQ